MTTGRLSLRACGPVIFVAVMGLGATGAWIPTVATHAPLDPAAAFWPLDWLAALRLEWLTA